MKKINFKRFGLIAAICAICMSTMTGCAAVNSCSKSLEADINYLDREVVVYHPYTGEKIFELEGKMLCNADDVGLAITTQSGYRYNIGNCTYVITEKE